MRLHFIENTHFKLLSYYCIVDYRNVHRNDTRCQKGTGLTNLLLQERISCFQTFSVSFPSLSRLVSPSNRPAAPIRRHNLTRHLLLSISGLTE